MKTKDSQRGFALVVKTALIVFTVGVLLAGCASDPEVYSSEQELENRLAELIVKLKQLDKMTAQLSQELEEKEQREKELMSKIGEGAKGPADTDSDGLVTVDEAYRYVSDRVPRATRQELHPVKKGTVAGSLVLSITR
jgi:hypothetical protein